MKALVYEHVGPVSEVITYVDKHPRAFISVHGEYCLVKVAASSITRVDWKGVEGYFSNDAISERQRSKKKAFIPGSAFSGVITNVGNAFSQYCDFKVGNEVIGLCSPAYFSQSIWSQMFPSLFGAAPSGSSSVKNSCQSGSLSEYVAVRYDQIAAKPGHLSHVQAATLPYSGVLAFKALKEGAKLNLNKNKQRKDRGKPCRVLIVDGDNPLGKMCTQLAHCFEAQVVVTAESNNSLDFESLHTLGADEVVRSHKVWGTEKFLANKFDIVIDCGGNDLDSFSNAKKVLKKGGRFVTLVPDNNKPITFGSYLFDIALNKLSYSSFPLGLLGDGVSYSAIMFEINHRYLTAISKLAQNRRIRPLVGKVGNRGLDVYTRNIYFPFTAQAAKIMFNVCGNKNNKGQDCQVMILDESLCGKAFENGVAKFNPRLPASGDSMNMSASAESYSDGEDSQQDYAVGIEDKVEANGGVGNEGKKSWTESIRNTLQRFSSRNDSKNSYEVGHTFQ